MITIYLDTSVISSYFDMRNPERMELTRYFWKELPRFKSYISDITAAEVAATPDAELRESMRALITPLLPPLTITTEALELAEEYIKGGAIPKGYPEDAQHIAVATVKGIRYLTSWNFKHIVRERTKAVVNLINIRSGYGELKIVTPPELV